MSIRIILADDHEVFVDGLKALLANENDFEVVAVVNDGRKAIQATRQKRPDVVVMDITMPGLNGVDATRAIYEKPSKVKVLCLSMHKERPFVLAMLRAGASGYLLKECASQELVKAVRCVARGETYLSSAIAGIVVEAYRTEDAAGIAELERLTPREREVLQLIAEGHTSQDIAKRLGISVKTVATHREHVMRKLDIHSVAGLTRYAIREGLTIA